VLRSQRDAVRLPPEDALARAITAEWSLIHSATKPTPLQIARALLARLAADPTIHRRHHDAIEDEAKISRGTTD
jgi:hypothetical protein